MASCFSISVRTIGTETLYGHMVIGPIPETSIRGECELTYAVLQRDISNGVEATLQRQEIMRYTASLENVVKERTEQLELEIKERKRTEEALKLANEDLALRSLQDGMTGLYNRAAFDDYLKRQWLVHRRDKSV